MLVLNPESWTDFALWMIANFLSKFGCAFFSSVFHQLRTVSRVWYGYIKNTGLTKFSFSYSRPH